jgi:histidyl-tRNA synthetase
MYQAPRGTADILPQDQPSWSFVLSQMQQAASAFGYRRIDTPIFESTGLFQRTVGEGTDIVEKEMYSFQDRGDQQLTLRPEGTASICRAYLEHGMHNQPQPVRLYYTEPMFRYDRPQAGRYRQFHQFGVEAIGDGDAAVDLEVLQLAMRVIEATGLGTMTLVLNNIGDAADRPAYLRELQDYYEPRLGKLCVDCQRRYQHNPLRLLDCKQKSCQPYLASAPRSTDHLGTEAQTHWEELLGHLRDLGVPYQLDHKLVRGLDYYTRTVFEVMPARGGSQSAICAGGRYDGLMEQLGGRPTPGIGFATGIERVMLNLRDQGIALPEGPVGPIVVAYRGATAKAASLRLAGQLRQEGTAVVLAPERSLKAQMRYASGMAAAKVLIIGDAELAKGVVTLREMTKGTQREFPLDRIVAELNPG